ncbi:transcription elongation factor GreA [Desulfovibrio ferrophilus]|uniref:Transcription elongation factor GreA n=1 Tax=Desulfovibrio ferrophilus TaxID=241368 RepID=A0A2Z6B0C1_9BACT|nr:transcription elongation factor GreA [Desulfovibrio ferrophilus]BBD08961.1 transcription elongation factor GreA [Desulfovibrio ferrophilus]
MNSIPISTEGYEKIKKELEELKKERPGVILAIKLAREEGDLKENAGYHAARERQGMLEAKINYIESRIPTFDIIDLNTMSGDKVMFGATVEVEDLDTEERKTLILLGPDETDHVKDGISVLSPVGRALLGKEEGDEVSIDVPRGNIEYEILSVSYNGPAIKDN